ncbi:ATP12 family chaperone protein [Sphingosinicella rhizophila]|uniref:ATP12 family protein n=1 Tax=Sphingosinicella rhizophila TaxID=3050082 RepID=A0ABU3Q749_9SPHN|nr:ATP12 family protein [Sphingosinicella sp. GR2756]MDT9599228.1 ATP12 family protein [Sphingosinicella sp. GR2756]
MKRFYKQAEAAPAEDGYRILLDGRPVKTPDRNSLVVPGDALGGAIAEEWNRQGERIDPRTMPFTGLANAAIDRVLPDPAAFASTLARYGESDLLCYRAEGPQALVERQAEAWDGLLDWGRQRFDVDFEIVCGIMHRPQPGRTIEQLGRAVTARDAFRLAGLSPLVTIAGSLLIALALDEGAIGLDAAWAAAALDESWQAETWGQDQLAAATLEARRQEFEAAYRFLRLL